jgi:hypothetical protein
MNDLSEESRFTALFSRYARRSMKGHYASFGDQSVVQQLLTSIACIEKKSNAARGAKPRALTNERQSRANCLVQRRSSRSCIVQQIQSSSPRTNKSSPNLKILPNSLTKLSRATNHRLPVYPPLRVLRCINYLYKGDAMERLLTSSEPTVLNALRLQ